MRLLTFIFILLFGICSQAQLVHERLRRVTVFPIRVDNKELADQAESLWWDLREQLTESKRFLIASKNFMQVKDVFQPRGALQAADAIILGRLLDAHALITFFLVDHQLSMRVYETKNGLELWRNDVELHSAVPISKQLGTALKKMMFDFLASIPYQGFVTVDNLIGRPSYNEGDKLFFKADIGVGTQVTVGDTVQLITLRSYQLKPLFQDGATVEFYAEGKVVNVDRSIITVQVTRKQPDAEIRADALVRIPDELRRMREIYGLHEDPDKNIPMSSMKIADELTPKQKEIKPLVTSISWIANFILVLFLAF